ncbi:RHTO0S12e00276g1_1 [Rhodotorula toruloides]|uniref:Sister chromatid cohesion protein n=1 Tax=Rhodotorula toruloides TaxID=5286 RepID=A0A061BGI9_RHOTO|nr:RHTO0S12e00276g1_1 [Rhodotorula toruloides]
MPPDPPHAHSPSPSTSSASASQQAIASSARGIVKGWAVGSGLEGAGDVVSHLPPILPSHPSFFPQLTTAIPPTHLDPSSSSLVPTDPLFSQYSRELAGFMAPQQQSAQHEAWRLQQLAGVLGLSEVRGEMDEMRRVFANGGLYGGLPPLQPPYPVLTHNTPLPPPPLPPSALSSAFLSSDLVPPPSATSFTGPSNPPGPRHLAPPPPHQPTPDAAIRSLVNEHTSRAKAEARAREQAQAQAMQRSFSAGSAGGSSAAEPSTPSHPGRTLSNGHAAGFAAPAQPFGTVPASSPDPLLMQSEPASEHKARRIVSATVSGVRYDQGAGPSSQGAHGLSRKRSSDSDVSSHFSSPLKPNAPGSGLASQFGPRSSQGEITPSTTNGRTTSLGEPFTGAESAVKRFKLESGQPAVGSSGRGAPGTGGTTGASDAVERLSDLLSDVFNADDSMVDDTSAAQVEDKQKHLRSPGKASPQKQPRFLRVSAVSASSGLPLLHTDTLRKMGSLVRTIASKNKAEELVEEVEESGVGRWLKVLERSWEGISGEGWEGWDVQAALPKEDEGAAPPTKGKGKAKKAPGGKGRKGSASPAKKGKGKGKERAQEDYEDDDELDMLASSPIKAPTRRSTRSPSPHRAKSATADAPDSDEDDSQRTVTSATYWDADPSRLQTAESALRDLADALIAIRLALDILTLPSVSLPKHLFSSEYLLALVSALRRTLDNCIVPILSAPGTSPLAELASIRLRDKIAEACDGLVQATQSLASLVKQEDLGDELVIAISYFSLEPYFHEAPPTTGRSAAGGKDASPVVHSIKALRLAALAVIQAVYARFPEQRSWIVEEVLGNLGRAELASGTTAAKKAKGGIRLRTGATIQTVSALLLHLVQTCPADLQLEVRKKLAQHAARANASSSQITTDGDVDMEDLGVGRRLLDDEDKEDEDDSGQDVFDSIQRRLVGPALEQANKAARTIVGFLLQRSAKAGKTTGAAADTEYRAVLDHLVADLLATLRLPEWPGAEVLLTVLCRSMMATLADPKSSHENNALKGIALEHLGNIASRICKDLAAAPGNLPSLRDLVSAQDVDGLEKVFAAEKAVLEHLAKTERSTGQSEGALAFMRADYANDLLQARQHAVSEDASQDDQRQALVKRLGILIEEVWNDEPMEDVFGPSPEDSQPKVDGLALDLWRSSTLPSMYQALLDRIVDASESTQVTLRTKALRAVSLVVAQDPDLFHQDNIRRTIENRMLDSSPAVRDATIELVGKYVVSRPDLARHYLPKLGERISDTGLSVRRRVVKLLKVLYGVVDDEEQRVDICRRLVYRVLDEDDGIKELAVDAVEDLWFGATPKSAQQDDAARLAQLASIITQTTGNFKERPPPVDEALRAIMAKHAEKGTKPPLDRLREVIESLVDGLVEDDRSMNLVAGIKTVFILSAVDASLLSTQKATLLLPFLKSATTTEEQVISDYLLRIFRAAVVAMPKTSSKFGKDLQTALMPMLNKPSQSVQTLQEVMACFCAVVHGQTQDFTTMIRVFGVTLGRLQGEAQKLTKAENATAVNTRQLPILCYMTGLLCEHGDFDRLREEQPDTKDLIDLITPGSIAEHTFATLLRVHSLQLPSQVKPAVLTSLGFIYRAHPTLMMHASSTAIMDAIFDSPNPALHVQVLRIIQDFLASQERAAASVASSTTDRKAKKKGNAGVKMEELVGNVEGFADSGVASAIAQRYLNRIVDASLSPNPTMQRIGVDLLSTIARSGFSHPLSLSPTLVALTASPDPQLSAKAFSTLSLLHQKHASLLATRFLEPAKSTHGFLAASSPDEPARGFRGDPPESMLGRWYALLHKEKRQVQLDYLRTLSRAFEVDLGAKCDESDVSFARFLAESLSTLDYKRTEEPLLVISYLNSALAVSGLQVLHALEMGLKGGGGLVAATKRGAGGSPKKSAAGTPAAAAAADDADEQDTPPSPDLARQSVISGLALLLRDHLKQLYGITDAKLAKYVVGKKSAMGDKAVTRRPDAPLALGLDSYDRMPFALKPMSGEEDLVEQRATYIRLIAEDGTIGAMEELEAAGAEGEAD